MIIVQWLKTGNRLFSQFRMTDFLRYLKSWGVTPLPLNVCPYPLFLPPSPSIVTQDVRNVNMQYLPVKFILTFFPLCILDPIWHQRTILSNAVFKCLLKNPEYQNSLENVWISLLCLRKSIYSTSITPQYLSFSKFVFFELIWIRDFLLWWLDNNR
jgi:hypothetical protein